jgi:hypothetical protein
MAHCGSCRSNANRVVRSHTRKYRRHPLAILNQSAAIIRHHLLSQQIQLGHDHIALHHFLSNPHSETFMCLQKLTHSPSCLAHLGTTIGEQQPFRATQNIFAIRITPPDVVLWS